jgi:hypothetical protein
MSTYYVDPSAGSRTAPYDTWAKAASSLSTIFALPPSAGDIIYARGTETIAAELDVAGSGTNAGGFIKLIGCNASGDVDGTRYVVNAGGNGIHCIDWNGSDLWWVENLEVKNTASGSYDGFYTSVNTADGCVFINCCANTCGRYGFTGRFDRTLFYRCVAYSNGLHGFSSLLYACAMLFCCSRDNAGIGFYTFTDGLMFGCLSYDNTDDGINPGTAAYPGRIMNCVVDNNGDDGILISAGTLLNAPLVFGCRVTNQSGAGDIGINAGSEPLITGYCYFENNDGDNIQNATLHYNIPLSTSYTAGSGSPTSSNVEDQSNTNQGYTSLTEGSEDYNLRSDASSRRTAIAIPTS